MREYIGLSALGDAAVDTPEGRTIVISFYGPKGGSRAIETVELDEAVGLMISIEAATRAMAEKDGFTHPAFVRWAEWRRNMKEGS